MVHPVHANEIFVRLPTAVTSAMRAGGVGFQHWGNDGQVRFVCAFDTNLADVERALNIARSAT